MGIGKNIEELRKHNNLTQNDLGNMLHISNKTISSWEKDRTEPNIGMIEAMCNIFQCKKTDIIDGVSREYLMTGEEPERTSTSGNKYYFDDESAELADFAHKNPDYKVLFDASRKVKPEDINFVLEMIKRASSYGD